MKKQRKTIREKGKIRLSRMFQEFKEGDRVAVIREVSQKANLPRRFQGSTGTVIGKRGNAYLVAINDANKKKKFIINPIHLKRIQAENKIIK